MKYLVFKTETIQTLTVIDTDTPESADGMSYDVSDEEVETLDAQVEIDRIEDENGAKYRWSNLGGRWVKVS